LEIAVYSSVICFNSGYIAHRETFETLGLQCSNYFLSGAMEKDEFRVSSSNHKETYTTKQRRKKLRATKKGYRDAEKEKEGGVSHESERF